jgi:hypothetical protein
LYINSLFFTHPLCLTISSESMKPDVALGLDL